MTDNVTSGFSRFIAAFLVFAAIVASSGWARAENDNLIVPWRRVGPVTLGMSASEVIRLLGEPTQTNSGPYVTVYIWRDNMSVTAKTEDAYVTQICALSPNYETARGLHPGLSDATVTSLMGEPQSSHVYHGWWKLSYVKLFWGGLMVSVPLTGFESNHSVQSVCVNHNE